MSNYFPRFLRLHLRSLCLVGIFAILSVLSLSAETLQKGPVYFYDRYGTQKFSKAVVGYKIYTPFKYSMVPIEDPCLIRKYSKDGVMLEVLFSDPKLEALWVRITLQEKFTSESLAAALAAYGSGWKRLSSPTSVDIEIPIFSAKILFQSEEGRLAFFSAVTRQLALFSTDAIATSKQFHQKRAEDQAKVPVF